MTLEIASRAAPVEIIDALRSPRQQSRLWAIDQLKLAPPGAADDLLGHRLHDDDRDVRMAAIHAIGERRNLTGLRCLYGVITTSDLWWRGPDEQKSMVGAYAKIGARGAVKPLAKLLDTEEADDAAKVAAIVALAWIRTAEAHECLTKSLRHPSARVRDTSRKALAMIKERALGLRGPSFVKPLVAAKKADPFQAMIPPARLPTACIAPLEEETIQGNGAAPVRRLSSSAFVQEDCEATVMCPSYRQATTVLSPS